MGLAPCTACGPSTIAVEQRLDALKAASLQSPDAAPRKGTSAPAGGSTGGIEEASAGWRAQALGLAAPVAASGVPITLDRRA